MQKIKHVTIAGTATLGPKGQVVIPADVREKMGISPGDKLIALYVDGKQSIAFITEEQAQALIDQMGAELGMVQEVLKENR